MTNDDAQHVDALINHARANGSNAGRDKRRVETRDSIEDARREAFDDGYLQGVTVSREIIEKRIVPLIDSLETVAIALRNALGLVGQPPRADRGDRDRRARHPEF